MKTYPSMCATIVDFGLFVEFAVKLAPFFGKMNYWSPNKSSFPQDKYRMIGAGLKGVNRVNDYHEVLGETDILIVPDVFLSELQLDCEDRKILVWGSKKGDELELYRAAGKKYFEKIGLDVGPWELITGIDNLRAYIKEHPDVYVKADDGNCRGDFETFGAMSYDLIEPRLDKIESDLGVNKHKFRFVVEAKIKTDNEPGYDGGFTAGKYFKSSMAGCEEKDLAYMGVEVDYTDLPDTLQGINDALIPALTRYNYCNFLSTEAKVLGKKAFVLDLTMRAGSPPSEIYMNNIKNLAEVIVEGAKGNHADPVYEYKYGGHCFMYSAWAEEGNRAPIKVPEKYRDNVKLRNFMKRGDLYHVLPTSQHPGVLGAIVSCGNDREKIKAEIKEISEAVKSYGLSIELSHLETADKKLTELMKTFKKAA